MDKAFKTSCLFLWMTWPLFENGFKFNLLLSVRFDLTPNHNSENEIENDTITFLGSVLNHL